MLRTVVTVGLAAVAAAALAACGPVQLGAAAITGNQTISAGTLTSEVSSLQGAYQASHGSISLQFPVGQAPQRVLSWLVRFQIQDRLAARNGITVTQSQVQHALAGIASQAKANGMTLTALAVANGIPPDMLGALGRYQAIETVLVNRLDGGKLPTASAALQALGKRYSLAQCRAAKSLTIKINPQYGQLDYSQLGVTAAPSTLSAPPGGNPTPSPAPQLTPPC